jgi:hypothetical protein
MWGRGSTPPPLAAVLAAPSPHHVSPHSPDPPQILKAARCNNHLDVTRLQAAVPDLVLPPVHESMHGVFQRMRDNLKADGIWPPPPRKGPKPT